MPEDGAGLEFDLGVSLSRLARNMAAAEARIEKAARKVEQVTKRAGDTAFSGMGDAARRAARETEAAFTAMQRRINAATGVGRQSKSAASSATFFEEAERQALGVDRLRQSLDPLYAAQQRLAAGTAQLEAAVSSGAITDQQAAQVKRLLTAQYELATQAATRSAAGAAAAGQGFSRFLNIGAGGRFVLQNTAAQIGDIAVQLEAGTAKSRVAAQQLPQLFGGFSALGGALGIVAPLLGTVAAVGIPVGAMLLTMGNNADDAEEKVRSFADRLDDARAALGRAEEALATASTGGIEDLLEKYGQVTEAVRTLAIELADIEVRAATVEVKGAVDLALGAEFEAQIEALFGGVGGAIAERTNEELELARRNLEEFETNIRQRESLNIRVDPNEIAILEQMRQEVAALAGDFENMGTLLDEIEFDPALLETITDLETRLRTALEAGNFIEVANLIAQMRDRLRETGAELDQGVTDGLTLAEALARETANGLGQAADAAGDVAEESGNIAPALSGAVSEAAALAVELGISLDLARRIASFGPQGRRPGVGGRGDPRKFGGSFFDYKNREGTEFLENYEEPGKSSDSSGGSGSAERPFFEGIENDLEALERQIELLGRSAEEVATLTARYKLLDEAQSRGIEVTDSLSDQIDEQAAAIGRATVELERMRQEMQFVEGLEDQFLSSFLSDIAQAESATDALAGAFSRLALQIAEAYFQAALFGRGPFSDGSGGGLLSGILGGIAGFAEGGYTGPGPKNQPKGVVHAGEYVFNQEQTRKIGVGNLEALARGGVVNPTDMSRGMAGAATSASPVNVAAPVTHVRAVIVDDPAQRNAALFASPQFEDEVLAVVERHRS